MLGLRQTLLSHCSLCHSLRYASTKATTSAPPSSSSRSRATTLPVPVLDLSDVLNDPTGVKRNLKERNSLVGGNVVDRIREMEIEAIALRREIQGLRERRNKLNSGSGGGSHSDPNPVSKAKGSIPRSSPTATSSPSNSTTTNPPQSEAALLKSQLKTLEPRLTQLNSTVQDLALSLPNFSHPWSPIGPETSARLIKILGPSIPSPEPPANPALDHLHLSSTEQLGWTDFPSSSLISGPSWSLLKKEGALLELALINYSMSIAISHGFDPVLTPDVVKSEVAERCGFAPREKDAQQTYFLSDGTETSNSDLCLVGTAEVPLVSMSASTIFAHAQLPLKSVALGRAFRAEAGARGTDSRGLYRVHQFSKVEMVVVCREEDSDNILEELRGIQEEILGGLGLSLRVLDMPTEELGASAHRKYDIEAWMPGRGKWGELSSASNCTNYQSRRLSIRYKPSTSSAPPFETLSIPTPAALEATALYPQLSGSGGSKLLFAHTLNATAAAVPRLIVALLENGAVLDSEEKVVKVRLPKVLKRFWIGKEEKIEWF